MGLYSSEELESGDNRLYGGDDLASSSIEVWVGDMSCMGANLMLSVAEYGSRETNRGISSNMVESTDVSDSGDDAVRGEDVRYPRHSITP